MRHVLVAVAVLALACPYAATPARALTGHPTRAEEPFVRAAQRDLSRRFPTAATAVAAGFVRYTEQDSTGAISYANRQWISLDAHHPSQLWFDVHGRLLGADFSVLKRNYPKRPHLWGIDPSRWIEQSAHVHYVVRSHDGKMIYGYVIPADRIRSVGGDPNHPTAQDIVKLNLARSPSAVNTVFLFPNIWDLEIWIYPNPDGAFALKNPLVHVSSTVDPPSSHCASARSRQFDFWLGSWVVRNFAGVLEGRNTVTREYGGCVVQERFRSNDGSSFGSSFSFYDPSDARWHYTWVDNLGAFERLAGERVGAGMVMSGFLRARSGAVARERMTWTPLPRGTVRQLWQASFDGTHWRTLSDVYYWPIKT